MRAYDIISKKRDGFPLSFAEIELMVKGYLDNDVSEGQMAAWLMAVYLRGLDRAEILALTKAMIASGKTLDLSGIPGPKVDKHSTGGVGDKLSLVVVPLAASAGIKVPKMAGRSLGHTGGTLDKLESIPGFRTDQSIDEFIDQVNSVGASITGQSKELVPADKKIYALRDRTATVSSIPLIAASVMSKKLAAGADSILLDVKAGSGAFAKELATARELAENMVSLGQEMGRPTRAIISDMNQPMGRAVGNTLEVEEAIEILRGAGPEDVRELALAISSEMMILAGLAQDGLSARQKLAILLSNGQALEKFREIIAAQNGDAAVIDDPDLLPHATETQDFIASTDGYLVFNDCELLGKAALELGAGRRFPGGTIDYGAGLLLLKKAGQPVIAGETLIKLYFSANAHLTEAVDYIASAVKITKEPPEKKPLIYEVI